VYLAFFIEIKSFRSHYCPGVDSASNRNECQEHFLGSKGGRCVRLTILPPSCAVVMKSWKVNFLEPSGPLLACNGSDLPSYVCPKLFKELLFPYISTHKIWSKYDMNCGMLLIASQNGCCIRWCHRKDFDFLWC